ncbi:unnamed protein product [Amoebophrya sp. A25]|nr:unnamed protein product [Amoebophrya sp. A25]|eukprot:GSA25T00007258001.1
MLANCDASLLPLPGVGCPCLGLRVVDWRLLRESSRVLCWLRGFSLLARGVSTGLHHTTAGLEWRLLDVLPLLHEMSAPVSGRWAPAFSVEMLWPSGVRVV